MPADRLVPHHPASLLSRQQVQGIAGRQVEFGSAFLQRQELVAQGHSGRKPLAEARRQGGRSAFPPRQRQPSRHRLQECAFIDRLGLDHRPHQGLLGAAGAFKRLQDPFTIGAPV